MYLCIVPTVILGGHIINVCLEDVRHKWDYYKGFGEYLRGLEAKGLWENLTEEVRPEIEYGKDGLIQVWRVTKYKHRCNPER